MHRDTDVVSAEDRELARENPLFMNSRGDRNCVWAGRSAVISCSKTAPETSSTTRTLSLIEARLRAAITSTKQQHLDLAGLSMVRVRKLP
jgi:hypothetical protein